jgi:hypothetical protein
MQQTLQSLIKGLLKRNYNYSTTKVGCISVEVYGKTDKSFGQDILDRAQLWQHLRLFNKDWVKG